MSYPITIQIPTALRPQVGDQATIELDSADTSVRALLGSLTSQYPELGKRLFKSENELNRFVNVYLNDEDIRFLNDLDTCVKSGDELSIVPAIAGG